MEPSGAFTERRTHPRSPLRLPARVRWQGPLGLRVEMTETVDVSRDGVLVQRNDFCEPLARVWIVFPLVRGAGVWVQLASAKGGGFWVGVRVENADRESKSAPPSKNGGARSAFEAPCPFSQKGLGLKNR